MTKQTATPQVKTMVGRVVSTGMVGTVAVEVTTFKVHPLYHKRYRWTKKYLSGIGDLAPQVGDTVKIVSHRPVSKLKRWMVAEVVEQANPAQQGAAKKAAKPQVTTTKAGRKAKKS
jgi:small subunit ribosomal protein S17